jgi:hypothetical protein
MSKPCVKCGGVDRYEKLDSNQRPMLTHPFRLPSLLRESTCWPVCRKRLYQKIAAVRHACRSNGGN